MEGTVPETGGHCLVHENDQQTQQIVWHEIVICLVLVSVFITFQNSLGFLVSGCQSGIFLYIISLFLTPLFFYCFTCS